MRVNAGQQEWMVCYAMGNVKPLPKDYKPKGRIDYAALKLAKSVPDRNKDYLDFVRAQVCAAWSTECDGVTEAAHMEAFGRGIKASDFYAVPLCTFHHRRQHNLGVYTFTYTYGADLWEAAARLLVRWIRGERA